MTTFRFSLRSSVSVCTAAVVIAGSILATPVRARAMGCAQPVSSGSTPVASDCLYILGAAVGSRTCEPECICAPNGSLPITASQALLCLLAAVGQQVTLDCPCDGGGTLAPGDMVGVVGAVRSTSIVPPFFPGLPFSVTDSMSLTGSFGFAEDPTMTTSTVTMETIGPCVVTTSNVISMVDPNEPLPTPTVYDPGTPGEADNGTKTLDLVGSGTTYSPVEAPLQEGFDGGQTVTFSWPGGVDVSAFSDSIAVPDHINVTSPDLLDIALDLEPGKALGVAWTPGSDDDGMMDVTVSTGIVETTIGQDGIVTSETDSVTIECMFADSAGAGTIPAAAMADIIDSSSNPLASLSQSLGFTRRNTKDVMAPSPTAGGDVVVKYTSSSVVSRIFAVLFSLP